MNDYLLEVKTEVDAAQNAGKSALSKSRVNYYEKRYSKILCDGRSQLPIIAAPKIKKRGRVKQHK